MHQSRIKISGSVPVVTYLPQNEVEDAVAAEAQYYS
jgi:hypothetical protein